MIAINSVDSALARLETEIRSLTLDFDSVNAQVSSLSTLRADGDSRQRFEQLKVQFNDADKDWVTLQQDVEVTAIAQIRVEFATDTFFLDSPRGIHRGQMAHCVSYRVSTS